MELFNELLQVALGLRKVLSRSPSDEEWCALFEMAQKQAVAGIAIAALEKLSVQEQKPPQMLLLEWIGLCEQIRTENIRLNKCCQRLQKKFFEAGVQTSILKGQGIACYYDDSLRELRQSGDIDIYVDCSREKALALVKNEKITVNSWDYKHAQLDIWDNVVVEMHYRVEVLLNLRKNRKLQKWFKENKEQLFEERDGLVMPTVPFNVFYVLLHIYRHFLYEGVGMRQIMDYYMVLHIVNSNSLDVDCSKDAVIKFGMDRFAKGLMWVMQKALGMPREWMLWEPDAKEGQYILEEVMAGGNFGHHDHRLTHGGGKLNTVKQVCKHNCHLMSHYPADVVWAPVWFVWHKYWKLKTKASLSLRKTPNK